MSDQRQHTRVNAATVAIRVRFNDVADLEEYYLRDISRGGIFLRAKNLKPLRSLLIVVLTMPDGGEIRLTAEVVHVVTPEQSSESTPTGMGVQFLNLTPEVREQIEDYVRQLKLRAASQTGSRAAASVEPSSSSPRPGTVPPTAESVAAPIPLAASDVSPSSDSAPPLSAEDETQLLRRICWLLSKGALVGRPVPELFGVSKTSPVEVRRAVFERLRKALAVDKPPLYLGWEEAQAISTVLSIYEQFLSDAKK